FPALARSWRPPPGCKKARALPGNSPGNAGIAHRPGCRTARCACRSENEKGALPQGMCALRRRALLPWTPDDRCRSRPLRGLLEIGQVPAEEVARALLHLPDPLAGEAPLLAEVLQRPRIVLRQAVAQDVPGQLAHALAHPAEGVADVLVLLSPQELGIRTRRIVGQPVEVRGLPVAVGP